jgi:hypothetical protein
MIRPLPNLFAIATLFTHVFLPIQARADYIASRLPAPDPRVRYLISHQWPDSDAPAPPGLTIAQFSLLSQIR